mgnify:FL=1
MHKIWETYRKQIEFCMVAILLFILFRYFIGLLAPFLVAAILMAVYEKPVCCLKRKTGIGGQLWTAVLLLLTVLLLILLFWLSGRKILACGMLFWERRSEYQETFLCTVRDCCGYIETGMRLEKGMLWQKLQQGSVTVCQKLSAMAYRNSYQYFTGAIQAGAFFLVTVTAILLYAKDWEKLQKWREQEDQKSRLWQVIGEIMRYLRVSLLAIALLCLLGFRIAGLSNAPGLAVLTAFLDVLPFIGTGIVILPMAVWQFLKRNLFAGIVLLLTYASAVFAREYLEPKLISHKMGVSPVLTLLGIYAGVKVFGIGGIVLGPLYVIILAFVYRSSFANLKNTFVER